MNEARSVESSVEVAADPDTAFAVFTEEIDCWWLQGPINFYDSSKAYTKRIEPGIGGRIVEVYDPAAGEGLEVARITVWEPGSRIGWQSSVDDVVTDVTFAKSDSGTVVRVVATIPAGGADRGGTAWVRTVPAWLGAWMAKRDQVPRQPFRLARLAVAVHYARPSAAARWLRDVLGLEPAGAIPEEEADGDHVWLEFHVGSCAVFVFGRPDDGPVAGSATHTPWVFVDDLDAHYERVRRSGATIVQEIWHHGVRAYEVADPEGNRWSVAQASPLMMT